MHVRDVDGEERRLQVSLTPEIVHPPEDVVLEEVIACNTEAAQGRHPFESRLERQGVRQVQSAVVHVEAAHVRVLDPLEERRDCLCRLSRCRSS